MIFRFLGGYGEVSREACNRVDDLLRAMSVLDGKPIPDTRKDVFHQIAPSNITGQAGNWSCAYFELKWHKNGMAHVTFLRPDLVDGLNRIMAKRYPLALPAAA